MARQAIKYGVLSSLLLLCLDVCAWDWWPLPMAEVDTCRDTINYLLDLRALTSSGQYAPFWLQTNRDGDIDATAHSGNLTLGITKQATRDSRWWDYDFAVTLTGRAAPTCRAYTNNLYAHVRLYIVDVTVGIKPLRYNSGDDLLTSGGLLFSGNARPMPRITAGIERWTAFPGLYGYLEFKGGLSNMWMTDNIGVTRAMIHHKYIGARVGGKLPVRLSYEFHHAAQWGGYSPRYGDLGNNLHTLWTIFKAGAGGSMSNDQMNAQGNHIGEQRITLDARFHGWTITAYWHNMFEDGPVRFITSMMTRRDGLWGINVQQDQWPYISSLTYEFIHTTDQSGPYHDRNGMVFGGADNYYNNGVYTNGWSYYLRTLGTPFITSPVYNEDGSIAVTNNRVKAHYIGIRGDIYGFCYRAIVSHQQNYGQYFTNPRSTLLSTNTAWMLEVEKHVEKAWGLDFGLTLGGDAGSQFGNTFGAMLHIRKNGILMESKK